MAEPNLVTDTTRPFMLDIKALVPTQFSLLKVIYIITSSCTNTGIPTYFLPFQIKESVN